MSVCFPPFHGMNDMEVCARVGFHVIPNGAESTSLEWQLETVLLQNKP